MSLPGWLLLISALLLVAVMLSMLSRRFQLPLTVVLAVLGFLAGAAGQGYGLQAPLTGEGFEQVVVLVFLPVLVFAAVLELPVRDFLRDLLPIMMLATVALLVSAALVGLAVHAGLGMALASALLFGALISATDPVAVVAVFEDLGVPRRLLTLVEGESLLNDGVAIVTVQILLLAALGDRLSIASGLVEFVRVFFGGAAIGLVLGMAAAAALPWLDRLSAAALSVAVAYGGFVFADAVLGLSGVMATVAAGLVLAAAAPSRASEEVRGTLTPLWQALDYIANALLFLFIGLAINPELLLANLPAIGLAVVAVLVARPLAVVPLVSLLERFAGVTRVGLRNEAVLVWGGLRGGVALALALALPDTLPERDTLVAMTGGVVLATLLLNATTISALVRRLGLDEPTRTERFLAAGARLSAIDSARRRLDALDLHEEMIERRLRDAERQAHEELRQIELTPQEELFAVVQRGLSVERQTYQHLSDAGLLPPAVARTLLDEVEDQIDEAAMGRPRMDREEGRGRIPHPSESLRWVVAHLPEPAGEDPEQLAYAEASARRLAAQRTVEALRLLERLPNVSPEAVHEASETFLGWERDAVASLAAFDGGEDARRLRNHQAEALVRASANDALADLARIGVLPRSVARTAALTGRDEAEGGAPTSGR